MQKTIKNALISVFHKDGIDEIAKRLSDLGVQIFSTGGTQKYIEKLGIEVSPVEGLTGYPSVFGGRVKTLHPKVFGGILHRRELAADLEEAGKYEIPSIDLVIVDLYPFEKTVEETSDEQSIIEKIDIGGISLIRAAAKNFKDVLCVSEVNQYPALLELLNTDGGESSLEQRKLFARKAFEISSHYDTCIHNYFLGDNETNAFKTSSRNGNALRYGENPHQSAKFFGDLEKTFKKLNGKELSYNNLVDVDAAIEVLKEFSENSFAILKHTNVCGCASREEISAAYDAALAGDNVSAFGGILITNSTVDLKTAEKINELFYEVLIAPSFQKEALELLTKKKKRIVLELVNTEYSKKQFKSLLNGVLVQDKDEEMEGRQDFQTQTEAKATEGQLDDLEFALKLVKHLKSNTIVLAKDRQLIGMGCGQTSRVDALNQAIAKAKAFGFDVNGAVMASDAFFPFPDCVQIAHEAGIKAVVQPGGSVKDQDSVDFCNKVKMPMVFSGKRHFKH